MVTNPCGEDVHDGWYEYIIIIDIIIVVLMLLLLYT